MTSDTTIERLPTLNYVALRSHKQFDAFAATYAGELTRAALAGPAADGSIVRPGPCSICKAERMMTFRAVPSKIGFLGAVEPDWTETGSCAVCGIINRQRAFHAFAAAIPNAARKRAYIAERRTPAFRHLRRLFRSLTGSEYLGSDRVSGRVYPVLKRTPLLRHEDLTRLSFASSSLDVVMSQEVMEHIPDYGAALAEKYRVLTDGGTMLCTAPFFPGQDATVVRAEVSPDGAIVHHHPPVYHGNPVLKQGSLCFNDFGWNLIDRMTTIGFRDAHIAAYWGPTNLGFPLFVMRATK